MSVFDSLPNVEANDGTEWRQVQGEWTGWMPGEDGTWVLTQEQMERSYPEVLDRWAEGMEILEAPDEAGHEVGEL